MIYLCIFETIYAVLLLRVGRVVVHLCDHNYSYGRIGGLRHLAIKRSSVQVRYGDTFFFFFFFLGILPNTSYAALFGNLV